MFRTNQIVSQVGNTALVFRRNIAMKGDVHLSNRRVMRKIRVGKARPAIFHQFETLVELSDGSVVKRTSQAPKDEIRMINDQRNSMLWNPNRSDLISVDANAADRVNKFKQRFASFDKFETEQDRIRKTIAANEKTETTGNAAAPVVVEEETDDYIELMGMNVQEVKGGQVFSRKANRKKK
ncbi:54S ribosomal protein L36, mitochondrial [[Candida] anglica]|uniref:54S ribosomal protein L36, mitochondrial n=1 Tax=[Candida] anglica TaxID=148631 RepID=A0ABP0EH95_9ASCO